METLEMPVAEELAEYLQWEDAIPHGLAGRELDVLALELWKRGNCLNIAAEEDGSDSEETVGCHASCL